MGVSLVWAEFMKFPVAEMKKGASMCSQAICSTLLTRPSRDRWDVLRRDISLRARSSPIAAASYLASG